MEIAAIEHKIYNEEWKTIAKGGDAAMEQKLTEIIDKHKNAFPKTFDQSEVTKLK